MYRVFLVCLIFIFIYACGEKDKGRFYTIGIIQITEDPLLDEARKGVVDSLREEGFVDGKNVRVLYKSAQGEISYVPLIVNEFVSEKINMFITNSTPCMIAVSDIVISR
jgi:putative ABC transport system substrate-binding protein